MIVGSGQFIRGEYVCKISMIQIQLMDKCISVKQKKKNTTCECKRVDEMLRREIN